MDLRKQIWDDFFASLADADEVPGELVEQLKVLEPKFTKARIITAIEEAEPDGEDQGDQSA